MEFVGGEGERRGGVRRWKRREGDESRGRRGGVGGWERQLFGSELSLVLRRGDVHRK